MKKKADNVPGATPSCLETQRSPEVLYILRVCLHRSVSIQLVLTKLKQEQYSARKVFQEY